MNKILAGGQKDKKVIKEQISLEFSRVQLIYFWYSIFDRVSPIFKTRLTLIAQFKETQSDYFSRHDVISGFYCQIQVRSMQWALFMDH